MDRSAGASGGRDARSDVLVDSWGVAAMRAPQWPIACGKGIMRVEFPPPLSWFVSAPPVIGHTGSTGSWLFYCPRLDVSVCGTVSQAAGGPVPFRFVPKLLRELQCMINRGGDAS